MLAEVASHVTAVDISPEMIAQLAARAQAKGIDNVELVLDGSCICAFNDPAGGKKIKVEGRWCCRKGKHEESRKASCAVCDEIRPAVCSPVANRVAANALCQVCRVRA